MMAVEKKRRGQPRHLPFFAPPRDLAPSKMPSASKPMLCTLIDELFDNPDWIFEPKFDGLRILGHFDGKKLTILGRNQAPQNFQFPDIVAALKDGLNHSAIVEGEVV